MYEIRRCEMGLKVMHFSHYHILQVPFKMSICAHWNECLYKFYNLHYVVVKILLYRTSDVPVDFVWPSCCCFTIIVTSFKES